jgi:hypothetical protein
MRSTHIERGSEHEPNEAMAEEMEGRVSSKPI